MGDTLNSTRMINMEAHSLRDVATLQWILMNSLVDYYTQRVCMCSAVVYTLLFNHHLKSLSKSFLLEGTQKG